MGWKSSSKTAPPPPTPPSTLSKLLPLLVLVVVVAVAGFVAFHIYCAASQVADSATKKLEKKHVTFNRDGVKVAVKEVQNEKYVDNTQRCVLYFGI